MQETLKSRYEQKKLIERITIADRKLMSEDEQLMQEAIDEATLDKVNDALQRLKKLDLSKIPSLDKAKKNVIDGIMQQATKGKLKNIVSFDGFKTAFSFIESLNTFFSQINKILVSAGISESLTLREKYLLREETEKERAAKRTMQNAPRMAANKEWGKRTADAAKQKGAKNTAAFKKQNALTSQASTDAARNDEPLPQRAPNRSENPSHQAGIQKPDYVPGDENPAKPTPEVPQMPRKPPPRPGAKPDPQLKSNLATPDVTMPTQQPQQPVASQGTVTGKPNTTATNSPQNPNSIEAKLNATGAKTENIKALIKKTLDPGMMKFGGDNWVKRLGVKLDNVVNDVINVDPETLKNVVTQGQAVMSPAAAEIQGAEKQTTTQPEKASGQGEAATTASAGTVTGAQQPVEAQPTTAPQANQKKSTSIEDSHAVELSKLGMNQDTAKNAIKTLKGLGWVYQPKG